MNRQSQRGFTLLEVLVALAILALVMVVLGGTVGSSIRAYDHLELKTKAWSIASDKLVEMQVFSQWPKIGDQTEKLHQDNIDWKLLTRVSKGPFNGTRKIVIEVRRQQDDADGGSIFRLAALLGKPSINRITTAPATTDQPPNITGDGPGSGAGR